MANFQKFNVLKYILLGLIAGLTVYGISLIFHYFEVPIFNYNSEFVDFTASTISIDLRNQVTQSGYYGQVGGKILDFLEGKLGTFSFKEFAMIIFGVIVMLLSGRILMGFTKVNRKWNIFLSFMVGGLLMGVSVWYFLKMDFMASISSILAYSLALGIIMQILINIKVIKFVQE